jgi:hypothetical protein
MEIQASDRVYWRDAHGTLRVLEYKANHSSMRNRK